MDISTFVPPVGTALIGVDMQVDFCPGGSLAVPHGDEVIKPFNTFTQKFLKATRPIFFSRDWHPPDTRHFAAWPPHCIQNTRGADFHPGLFVPERATIITKGDICDADGYSAFEGHNDVGVPLDVLLRHLGVTTLYIGGLATDYCVRATVLDGLKLGYQVYYLVTCSRAVNLKPNDGVLAEEQMEVAGAIKLSG